MRRGLGLDTHRQLKHVVAVDRRRHVAIKLHKVRGRDDGGARGAKHCLELVRDVRGAAAAGEHVGVRGAVQGSVQLGGGGVAPEGLERRQDHLAEGDVCGAWDRRE